MCKQHQTQRLSWVMLTVVYRSTSNPTPNFQVIADHECGLLFKNKRDRKVINVDPEVRQNSLHSALSFWHQAASGDNSSRHQIVTHEYTQVVIYDHLTRRKS